MIGYDSGCITITQDFEKRGNMNSKFSKHCRGAKLMELGFLLFLSAFIAIGCGSSGGSSDSSGASRAYDNSNLNGVYRVNLKIGKCEPGELIITIGNDPGRNDENYIYVPENTNSITKKTNDYSYVSSVSNNVLSVIKKYNDGDIMDVDFVFSDEKKSFTINGIITGNEINECSGEVKGDAVRESIAIDEEMPAELVDAANEDNIAWNLYAYKEPVPMPEPEPELEPEPEPEPDEEPTEPPVLPPATEPPFPRGNFAPTLKPIGYKIAQVGSELKFPLIAMDENRDQLEFSAQVNVPKYVNSGGEYYLVYRVKRPLYYIGKDPFDTQIDEQTSENARIIQEDGKTYFTWKPKRKYDDVEIIFTVTDNGVPTRSDSEKIRIKVYGRTNTLPDDEKNLDIGIWAWTSLPSTITMSFSVETQSGDPVPGMNINNFKVFSNGSTLHPTEANLTAFPAPENYDARILLMLDLSGSITSSPERLADLIQTAKEFVTTMTQNVISTKIAIYTFTTPDSTHHVKMLSDFTNETSFLHAAIDRLSEHVIPGASTNLYRAFAEGIEILDSVAPPSDQRKTGHLVVLLDGKDTAGIGSYSQAYNYVGRCRHKVYPIAFQSEDLDSVTLSQMRELGGLCGHDRFKLVRGGNDNRVMLSTSFKETAADIIWDSSKYYVVKFCTPMRKGRLIPQLDIIDPIGRAGSKNAHQELLTDNFYDGSYSIIEALKYKYYDFDGDGRLVENDCNDADPDNWSKADPDNPSKCVTCLDQDADGYGGSGCNVNSDYVDNNDKINPNMVDIAGDNIDSNCDGLDSNFISSGIEEEIQSSDLYIHPSGNGIRADVTSWTQLYCSFYFCQNYYEYRLTGYFPANFGQQFGYIGFDYPVPFDGTISFKYTGQYNWNYKDFYFGFNDLVWKEMPAPNNNIQTGSFSISAGRHSLRWGCMDSPNSYDAPNLWVWDISFDRNSSNAVDHDGDGYSIDDGDCNDNDGSVFPDAFEIPEDGIDQDCDGSDLLIVDFDHDGDGYTENQGDCDDTEDAIYPGVAGCPL